MEQPSNDIIRRCQAHDAEAFCELVGMYERPLFGFVYRILWNSEHGREAEDVVQEVFLKVYSHIDGFRIGSGARFSTWLFSIAHHHCVSLLRKRTVPIVPACDEAEVERMRDTRRPDPREAASQAETGRRVADAIASLPDDQRDALLLRCYEEMPYEEIAVVLGCSVGTAKSRVSRAREKLAAELGDAIHAKGVTQ